MQWTRVIALLLSAVVLAVLINEVSAGQISTLRDQQGQLLILYDDKCSDSGLLAKWDYTVEALPRLYKAEFYSKIDDRGGAACWTKSAKKIFVIFADGTFLVRGIPERQFKPVTWS